MAATQSLPFLLLPIPFGLLADRNSRLPAKVWAEVLRAAALLDLLATALSLFAAVLLLRLHEPPRPSAPPRPPWLELREGAAMVWQHAPLRPIRLTAVAWNLSWFVLQATDVPRALRTLGLDLAGVELTLAACGAGMVLGGLLAAPLVAAMPFGRAIQLGPATPVTYWRPWDGPHTGVADRPAREANWPGTGPRAACRPLARAYAIFASRSFCGNIAFFASSSSSVLKV